MHLDALRCIPLMDRFGNDTWGYWCRAPKHFDLRYLDRVVCGKFFNE